MCTFQNDFTFASFFQFSQRDGQGKSLEDHQDVFRQMWDFNHQNWNDVIQNETRSDLEVAMGSFLIIFCGHPHSWLNFFRLATTCYFLRSFSQLHIVGQVLFKLHQKKVWWFEAFKCDKRRQKQKKIQKAENALSFSTVNTLSCLVTSSSRTFISSAMFL